jgi:hypothetical protein
MPSQFSFSHKSVSARSRDGMQEGCEVRAQLAFIRALLDEIERFVPADPRAFAITEQLEEEVTRLRSLLGGTSADRLSSSRSVRS